jgi:hypothetical protein
LILFGEGGIKKQKKKEGKQREETEEAKKEKEIRFLCSTNEKYGDMPDPAPTITMVFVLPKKIITWFFFSNKVCFKLKIRIAII